MEIRPWDKLVSFIPPLTSYEKQSLKESIEKFGVKSPVLVLADGRIIDGFHRWMIANELGVDCPSISLELNEDDAYALGVSLNLDRRQLSFEQIKEIRERQKGIALKLRRQGKTQEEVAKITGIPRRTISSWEDNINNGNIANTYNPFDCRVSIPQEQYRPIYNAIKEGKTQEELAIELKISQPRISQILKTVEHNQEIEDLKAKTRELGYIKGKYDIIVIDPPWPYNTEYNAETRRVGSPYPEMSLEELEKLELPYNNDCVLWLWTTNAFMHDAFHLLENWEFEPKTILTWVKDRMGIGIWLRGKTEHCILATKGSPKINLTNQTTVIVEGKLREHSRKPEEFYVLVDSLCFGRKLDYFGREKREGWDIYGTEEFENSI